MRSPNVVYGITASIQYISIYLYTSPNVVNGITRSIQYLSYTYIHHLILYMVLLGLFNTYHIQGVS